MIQLIDPTLLKSTSYINGKWLPQAGNNIKVTNPATGETITALNMACAEDAEAAITSANNAFQLWKDTSIKTRFEVLKKWFDLIIANKQDLATLMTLEQGKTISESLGEINYGASYVEWFAEEAKRIYGDVINLPGQNSQGLVIRQPIGVVAAITPWNFPNAMITRKAAPALAAGCTIIIKPASETPLSALALAELADRAGIPAGVINIIVGQSRELGKVFTDSAVVRKLTFTGSTPVGKILIKQCADTVKRTSMELGGNAPLIIFDDADLDKAVDATLISKYRNSGQTCICANRIIVQEGIYQTFIDKLTAKVKQFKLGNGIESNTTHGPLVSEKAANDVNNLVQQAISQGAEVNIGGKISPLGACYFEPTILTNLDSSMDIFREEIFGPVAPIFKFSNEQEAVDMANDTEFGLASYIFTNNLGRAWRMAKNVEYGMVGINEVAISSEMIPFGGVKESGNGREGSKHGLEDYTEMKYICLGGLAG
ncbi:NAD-dependent succinate-semialdehyde dehydrogenase [Pseudoalteromonas neustonica]|uniref:NAD-dependent succinate-semialdehyde dehydrogenase n=1 Tax=Pseudoalteromonas neustonica TaxID=1840331 RepID=A0ABU9TZG8_9GAMM